MTKENPVQVTAFAMELFPASIQEEIVSERTFLEEMGVPIVSKVTHYPAEVSFIADELFRCAKTLFSNESEEIALKASDGSFWKADQVDRTAGSFLLSSGDDQILIDDYWSVLVKAKDRLRILEKYVSDFQLSEAISTHWYDKLSVSELTSSDIVKFESDVNNSVVKVGLKIRHEINHGTSQLSTLVPTEPEFWKYAYAVSDEWPVLETYVEHHVLPWISEGTKNHGKLFFQSGLRTSIHSSISKLFDMEQLSKAEILELAEHTLSHGSMFSQLGFIESVTGQLKRVPSVCDSVRKMVQNIIDEPVSGRYELISNLFFFVSGNLSLTNIFEGVPVFVRHLAEFSHASFLEEILISEGIDAPKAASELSQRFAQRAFVVGHLDGHTETRWIPEFALPDQLKAEFICRLNGALTRNKDILSGTVLEDYVKDGSSSLVSDLLIFPNSFLPGPLEGGSQSVEKLPDNWKKPIVEALSEEPPDLGGFNALVNGGVVFSLPQDVISLSVAALRKVQFSLTKDDNFSVSAFINGLSRIAAVCRNKQLADEIWLLFKRAVNLTPESIDAHTLLFTPITLAAAYEKADRDRKMCEMLEYVSWTEIPPSHAFYLLSSVRDLLDLRPQLWPKLGRCLALLETQEV